MDFDNKSGSENQSKASTTKSGDKKKNKEKKSMDELIKQNT